MHIVQGSGNSRRVTSLPHGSIFAKASRDEPGACSAAIGNIAEMLLSSRDTSPRRRRTQFGTITLSQNRFNRMAARTLRLKGGFG